MQPITIYIILAFVFVTIGFIAGALVALVVAEREKKQLRGSGDQIPDEIDRTQHTALIRLWSTPDGKLLAELKGRVFTDIDQASPEERQELKGIAEKWSSWLGTPEVVATPGVVPASTPVFTPVPIPVQLPPAPVLTPSAVKTIITPAVPVAVQPAGREKSMVEEIDEILQDLADRSDQPHSVKISHDFRDGIVVWVDGARHLGVENVPDPEIQKLIRAAVAEWERRSERAR
jgi:gas vesicle protein